MVSNFSIKEKRPPQRARVTSVKAMNRVGVRLIKIQLFQALACFKSMMREDQQALFVHGVCLGSRSIISIVFIVRSQMMEMMKMVIYLVQETFSLGLK